VPVKADAAAKATVLTDYFERYRHSASPLTDQAADDLGLLEVR